METRKKARSVDINLKAFLVLKAGEGHLVLEGSAAAEEVEHVSLDALEQGKLLPQDLHNTDGLYLNK